MCVGIKPQNVQVHTFCGEKYGFFYLLVVI
nr:MAG TPA: hypothetical protein [Caudoviricetes sp.]